MATVDWILLGILGLSFLLGVWRGLVYEVLSVFVWIAAFVLAQWFAPEVGAKLPMAGSAESLRYAAGFVVVFIGSAFVAGVLVQVVKRLVAAVGLRPVDRTLGAVFGLIRGAILLLAITVVMNMTALRSQADWQASQGASYLTGALIKIKPLLPQDFAKYLP
jgi:membrane protein required for colicin V production